IISYPMIVASMNLLDPPAYGSVIVTGVLLAALVLIGGYIAVWVYMNTRFFLTNESVLQEIQVSLFSRHEQTVSLVNIEDASFRQQGIIQTMFNYGSIRLSTEGDETTYRFDYVADPKQQIATLNNAVEAFKNGRPVIND
ncbi:MAG TPA: PH domain-containing protein, partial [Candidatus Saccharimonadales bacterium]|nr:PH domain-containing protein [Candidatus Saccharimonadales bacterium]